jgi:hypothetical protein
MKRKPQKLVKRTMADAATQQDDINELGERNYSTWSDTQTLVGHGPRDHTDMLHGLTHRNSYNSLVDGVNGDASILELYLTPEQLKRRREKQEKMERLISSVPSRVWRRIAELLDPADAASLAITSWTLREKVGDETLVVLALPENRHHRIRFLNHMDQSLPYHLLCFPCGRYHRRINVGEEKLKVDYVSNPVFSCPLVTSTRLPRMRLVHDRELPYTFIQLATRHTMYSTRHGIHTDRLARRWRDPNTGWMHHTRYTVQEGRLLMRVRSQVFAPPKLSPTAERHLLYEMQEYTPYFSVCEHWKDGELMRIVKCALSHVPEPPPSVTSQIRATPDARQWVVKPSFIVTMCDECRPARRCPECPTEYLVEVSMCEDKTDPYNRFKHALIVTRWSDLGDGSSPTASPEYCAINGINADYDSFSSVGRRAVAGVFESKVSGAIPAQRMISLNPGKERKGEAGHGWF